MPLLMCPNCNVGMKEVTRESILIDMCPQCNGVWLDRGELSKLIELSSDDAPPPPPPQRSHEQRPQYDRPAESYRRYDDDDDYKYRKQYKKSKMQKIFDIFD